MAACLAPAGSAQEKPAKDAVVWALDDTDKVHPLSGNLLSEGAEVYAGRTASAGSYRRSNAVWDAAAQTVKLHAGRNEFVSFQLVLERRRDSLHKVFVNATDLLSPEARISADHNIRFFKELYVKLNGEWYPDALAPFDIAGVTPLEVPDPRGPVSGLKAQAVWVDIYVPHEQQPGTYIGQIAVVHRNTNKQALLRLELEVGDFTLPDELGIDVDLMNYGFLNVERGWPDMVLDSPRHRAIELEFFRMAHEHRMTFAIVPYNHDGSVPKGVKPPLAEVGDKIRVADWRQWDERFGPLLSGEAFRDLPRSGQPVAHFFLPYNLMWPSDMRNWKKPEYRIEHLRVSQAIREHFTAKGWTRSAYQIYYNHKEHYNFFPWNLDEPTRDQDLDALRYLGSILLESFPDDSPVKVLYRLDVGHFHCENVRDCKNPRETSRQVIDALNPFVKLWNIGAPHYWANLEHVRTLKSQNKTLYFYSGTPAVRENLVKAVMWGWNGFKYEADGICFWNATDWGDWDTDAPAEDPYTNAGGRYQGFSMIFYPGSKFGFDGPIPSVRLKAMRRGFQDYEYLRFLERSGKASRADLVTLADRMLRGGKPDYPALRRAIYEKLARAKRRSF